MAKRRGGNKKRPRPLPAVPVLENLPPPPKRARTLLENNRGIGEWIEERDGSLEDVQEAHKDTVSRWKNAERKQEVLCGFPNSFRPLTRDEKKSGFKTPQF